MDDARATDDPEARRQEYVTVQEEMAKNLNLLFVVQSTSAFIYAPDVHGVRSHQIPDGSGEPGVPGLPRAVRFTSNIWLEGR